MQDDPSKLPHFVSCSGCGESLIFGEELIWIKRKNVFSPYKKGFEEFTDHIYCENCRKTGGNPLLGDL